MTAPAPRPARRVACPGCGAPAVYGPENPWRPFCSERCRAIDLGAWAAESYRIPLREGESEAPAGHAPGAAGGPDTPDG